MTVIVGAVTKDGYVTIAADSETTSGWMKFHERTKVWGSDPFIFGAAGRVRDAQVIRHHVDWPKFRADEDADVEAFLVRRVWRAIRDACSSNGVLKNDSGVESIAADVLIAWGGSLGRITGCGSAIAIPSGRIAIGSGEAEAMGALGDKGPWTQEQVIEAARRATLTGRGVGGQIVYASTKAPGEVSVA